MRIADSLGHTFSDLFYRLHVSSVIRGTLYKPATINDLNYHYHNGCCALLQLIMFMHLKRRRRKSSSSYYDLQFLRCNCNSWFNCMDLLNVMYEKTAEIPQVFLFLPYYIHITELTTES